MTSIQGIYIALYGRPADPAGLAHYTEVTNNGEDLSSIGDLSSVPEYQDRFADMSSEEIVTSIYESLFERTPDAEGLAFYVALLEESSANINRIAIDILNGAQNEDLATINAKIEAADLFTMHLDTQAEIDAYIGNEAAEIGRQFIDTVNADDEGTGDEADAFIAQLQGPDEGQGPGEGDDGEVGVGNGGTPNITLSQALSFSTLPPTYALVLPAGGENLGTLTVADYGKIYSLVDGATNSDAYLANGFSFAILDAFANIRADSGFLSDPFLDDTAQAGYSITDGATDFGDLSIDEGNLLRGADNFSDAFAYSLSDSFSALGTADAVLIQDADTVAGFGTDGDDSFVFAFNAAKIELSGLAGNDTITVDTGVDSLVMVADTVIDGGAGQDEIILQQDNNDDVIVLSQSSDDRDVILNYEIDWDVFQVSGLSADVGNNINAAEFVRITSQTDSGNTYDLGDTSGTAVIEFEFHPGADGALQNAIDGSELFEAIDSTGAVNRLAVTSGWSGYLVAYDTPDPDAFIYYAADANGNGFINELEISLVARVDGIDTGTFQANDFTV